MHVHVSIVGSNLLLFVYFRYDMANPRSGFFHGLLTRPSRILSISGMEKNKHTVNFIPHLHCKCPYRDAISSRITLHPRPYLSIHSLPPSPCLYVHSIPQESAIMTSRLQGRQQATQILKILFMTDYCHFGTSFSKAK